MSSPEHLPLPTLHTTRGRGSLVGLDWLAEDAMDAEADPRTRGDETLSKWSQASPKEDSKPSRCERDY